MKELFKELQERYCNLSSAMIFSKLVKGRKLSNPEIRKWFSKLVLKEDWQGTPKDELIKFYYDLSNGLK
jgi:hypothetical protein